MPFENFEKKAREALGSVALGAFVMSSGSIAEAQTPNQTRQEAPISGAERLSEKYPEITLSATNFELTSRQASSIKLGVESGLNLVEQTLSISCASFPLDISVISAKSNDVMKFKVTYNGETFEMPELTFSAFGQDEINDPDRTEYNNVPPQVASHIAENLIESADFVTEICRANN